MQPLGASQSLSARHRSLDRNPPEARETAARQAFLPRLLRRGTQESNLTLRFWRPRSVQLWACIPGAAGVEVTVGVTGFVARCGALLLIELTNSPTAAPSSHRTSFSRSRRRPLHAPVLSRTRERPDDRVAFATRPTRASRWLRGGACFPRVAGKAVSRRRCSWRSTRLVPQSPRLGVRAWRDARGSRRGRRLLDQCCIVLPSRSKMAGDPGSGESGSDASRYGWLWSHVEAASTRTPPRSQIAAGARPDRKSNSTAGGGTHGAVLRA